MKNLSVGASKRRHMRKQNHGAVPSLAWATLQCHYSAVGLKTVGFPLAGTTVFKQSPL